MRLHTLLFVVCLLVVAMTSVFAQAVGDYQSAATGNWNAAATWQRWNGTSWAAATAPPTGSGLITIRASDTVTVDVAVTITGTLKNQGAIGGGENLTIADGGTFQHDRNSGSLPLATWNIGSTLLITGTTANAPANGNQSFYNVTFNTPGLSSNLNLGWNRNTIGGTIKVVNTGGSRWQMTAPASGDSAIVTIMGDIIVEAGQFSSNGTGNSNTHIVIHQHGDVVVTGGNFSVSRGSQSGSGTTRWYLYGDSFSISNATTQNSNAAGAWFIFAKEGAQALNIGQGNTLTSLPLVVESGTTVSLGTSELAGSGRFVLDDGATLATAHAGGIAGALSAVTGTVTLSTKANYTFNGSVAQATSTMIPDTVNNMTVNNAAGVTLSKQIVVNGVLTLKAGVFDNTIAFTLGPSGSISYQGGSLKNPLTSVESSDAMIPEAFFVGQNYPNPFNPSTTIEYGLPTDAFVTAKVYNLLGQEVATLFAGDQVAGIHRLMFDASFLSSGVYLYSIQAGTSIETKQMILVK